MSLIYEILYLNLHKLKKLKQTETQRKKEVGLT